MLPIRGSAPALNRAISANELGSVLNDEEIEIMTRQTGLSREELLEGLAANLPEAVNQMTPAGPRADRQGILQLAVRPAAKGI